MFQTFAVRAEPARGRAHLPLLRAELRARGLDGFILPRTDAHQSEYLAPHDERVAWLTGFTGSAATVIVLADRAVLFTDGRYTLQAGREVDGEMFEIAHITDMPPPRWLKEHLPAGARLGYDPWLHTLAGRRRFAEALHKAGGELVAAENPVDAVWPDQPPPPMGAIVPHPLELAGVAAADKLAAIRAELARDGDAATVLTLSDSIAWAFNIRGSDIAHTPVALAFATLTIEGATLVTEPGKLDDDARAWLAPVAEIAAPAAFSDLLDRLGAAGAKVRLDPTTVAAWIADRLIGAGAELHEAQDPCIPPKARKNAAEIAGARAAHLRDGAALAGFLAWLDAEAPKGGLDEIAAVRKLEEMRRRTNALQDIAFETIAGAGANGAIVHYRVSEATNAPIESGSLFLVDSGGQYLDGTTDVTRTVSIGTASTEMRRLFTLVLKGHIAIARARFPAGTTGSQLDSLARLALWAAGHDFDHGTGHGVGSYLSVHEGPQRISKRAGDAPLEPGMILSNEPGVYVEGAFGIRIENLVLVTEAEEIAGGAKPMLGFETLTLAPIDRRLIVAELLNEDERGWLDAYHARVRDALKDSLAGVERAWLEAATEPL